jgi:hypothetical protein
LALHLHEHDKLNLEDAFLDATFTSGKRGSFSVEPTAAGAPRSSLVQEVLVGSFFEELPTQFIGNKAYDSYPRDETFASEDGIELIVPNRRGRKRRTQDERS